MDRETARDMYLYLTFVWGLIAMKIDRNILSAYVHTHTLADVSCIMSRELEQIATPDMTKTIFIYLYNICEFAETSNNN